MDEFYYEESNPKHVFLKSLIFIFFVGLCFGIFTYYKKINTIELKNISIEIGEKLSTNINDYLKSGKNNSNKYKLVLDDVDTNNIGKYEYKVIYNKHTKTGVINVIDTVKPEVIVDDSISIGKDEMFNPNLVIISCVDASLPCKATIKKSSDIEKLTIVGTYQIDINISDSTGNYVTKTINISVTENNSLSSKVTNDLDYYTNSENDDKIEHIFFKKFDKAIEEESEEYNELIQNLSTEDFSLYTEKEIYNTKLITVYNRYGYAIGFQILVTYYDGNTELLTKEVINNGE